jgi:hypothetical protein
MIIDTVLEKILYRVFIKISRQSWRRRVDCERTTDYNCLIGLNLTSLYAFLICRLTSGAFTIDSSTPTFTGHFNEHRYMKCVFSLMAPS